MNRTEFDTEYIPMVQGIYTRRGLNAPPKESFALEFPLVCQFSIDDVKGALMAHIATSKEMPLVNHIIEQINGSVADNAIKAWNTVNKVFDRTGTGETISFYPCPDGAAITYAILTVAPSWAAFGKWEIKDEPFRKQDFIKAYTAAIHQRMQYSETIPKVLKGHYEIANSKLPDAPRPVVNAISPQGDILKQVYRKLPSNKKNVLQGECGANGDIVDVKDMLKLLERKIFNA